MSPQTTLMSWQDMMEVQVSKAADWEDAELRRLVKSCSEPAGGAAREAAAAAEGEVNCPLPSKMRTGSRERTARQGHQSRRLACNAFTQGVMP